VICGIQADPQRCAVIQFPDKEQRLSNKHNCQMIAEIATNLNPWERQ